MKMRNSSKLAGMAAAALLGLAGCRSTETVKSGGAIEQAKAFGSDGGVKQAVARESAADGGATWPNLEPTSSGAVGCSH